MRKIIRFFPYYAAAFMFFGACSSSNASDVTVAQAQQMIDSDKNLVIIDVRTPEEYEAGHIPNAINIDFYSNDFQNLINDLDKDKKYLVYCRSGRRSANTLKMMKEMGFKNTYNMLGGMLKWQGQVEK